MLSATTSSSFWSIAIKTVGSRITANNNRSSSSSSSSSSCLIDTTTTTDDGLSTTNTTNNDSSRSSNSSTSGESTSFTLQVHPNDPLHSLSTKIESITGLSSNEQRLIYRGRIISVPPPSSASSAAAGSSSLSTIRDIHGLSDGETIHLVPRIISSSSPLNSRGASNNNRSNNRSNSDTTNFQEEDEAEESPSSASNATTAAALIGGLLSGFPNNYPTDDGLFSGGGLNNNNNNNGTATTATNVASLSGSDGMNLLTALLGLGNTSSGSGSGGVDNGSGNGGNNHNNNGNPQRSSSSRRGAAASGGNNGQGNGLGGIVSRAAMMGVLDDGSSGSNSHNNNSNTTTAATAAAVPMTSSLDNNGLVVAPTTTTTTTGAVRYSSATSSSSSSLAQPQRTTTPPGQLNNRSVDEIRSSRHATTTTTATVNPFNPNGNNTTNANSTTPILPPASASQSAAIRAARNRRRATAARLTASDIRVPDPGSMEPVRQGLMTLHTLLRNAELDLNDQHDRQQQQTRRMQQGQEEVDGEEKGEEEEEEEEEDLTENDGEQQQQQSQRRYLLDRHPLNSHRQWYRGQWLDALDTVNQWLEATIVDIVLPSDLLGNYAVSRSCNNRIMRQQGGMYNDGISQQQQHRPVEAVVSGNDLEGRRRLLLEPRPASEEEEEEDNSNNNMMGVYNLLNEGYRPRNDNDGVQLLLIHYNGWPHRWDEWIRSDSPRIRPFRTRTRHRIMSTHASPTPNTVFQAAPPTFIRDESDDEVERAVLLPELQRVISSVNDVLSSVSLPPPPPGEGGGRGGGGGGGMASFHSSSSSSLLENDSPPAAIDSSHLPWCVPNHGAEYFQSTANDHEGDDNSDDVSDDGYYNNSASSSSLRPRSDPCVQLNAAQLRQLAPLIDRLGRILTDAAPHIASLADALPRHSHHLPQARPVTRMEQVGNGSESFAAQTSRLYFGMNSENGHDDGHGEFANSTATPDAQVVEIETTVDPDLTDFVNGMVNTTRGGSSSDTNRDPSSSSLLASYLSSIGAGGALSAAGGGDNNDAPRVVRVGGGDGALFGAGGGGGSGSGIDIHIHAIVTGPGMTPAGLDGLVIGDGGTSVTRNSSVGTSATATPELQQSNDGIDGDEIDHLFSDLYSESPPPVNLHQNHRNDGTENCENLSQIFEECRSIEEESDSINSAATQPFDGEVEASTNEVVGPEVEEGASLTASGRVNESNDASNASSTIGTASSLDTRPAAAGANRRRSSTSFGSRMYRRTFGRLSGSRR